MISNPKEILLDSSDGLNIFNSKDKKEFFLAELKSLQLLLNSPELLKRIKVST